MSAAAPVSVRKAAAEATLQFDWLLGDKNFFSFLDLAGRLGLSDSFIEKLWDDKRHPLHVSGHEYNAGKGVRNTKRVARVFALRLLVSSARYTQDEKLNALLACLREFSADELLALADAARQRAAQKTLSA